MNDKPQRYAIVGMQFREKEGIPATAILNEVPPDEPCTLIRDPSNRYDRNAIQVWVRGQHVGFIPKTQNAVLAKFIDATGKPGAAQAIATSAGMASDGSVGLNTVSATVRSVDARLHKGNNKWPLVELA